MKNFAAEFVCNLKFRNNLPEIAVDPKLLNIPIDSKRFTECRILSNEQQLVHESNGYLRPDMLKSCPVDLIWQTLGEILEPTGEPLAPADEKLCFDGVRTPVVAPVAVDLGAPKARSSAASSPSNEEQQDLIESENDLINAIAETFEPCDEHIHPVNASLKACQVWDLVPLQKSMGAKPSLIQCNFDSALEEKDLLLLRRTQGSNEQQSSLEAYQKRGEETFAFLRAYNSHTFSEQGNSLALTFLPDGKTVGYSLLECKWNLKRRRVGAGSEAAKKPDILLKSESNK